MKIYRRVDNFEVQDAKDRSIEWAIETYGGEFVEVIPPAPPTALELASIASAKKAKKDAVLAKLKITEEEFNELIS